MPNVTWGVQKTWTHAALLALSRHYRGPIAVDFTSGGNCVLLPVSEPRAIGVGETLERACELAIQSLTDAEILAAAFPDHDGNTQPANEAPTQPCPEQNHFGQPCRRERGHAGGCFFMVDEVER